MMVAVRSMGTTVDKKKEVVRKPCIECTIENGTERRKRK